MTARTSATRTAAVSPRPRRPATASRRRYRPPVTRPATRSPGTGSRAGDAPGYPPPAYGQQPPPDYLPPAAAGPAYAPPGGTRGGPAAFAQPGVGSGGRARRRFDPKTVDPLDWGIIGAGVLAFLFSLFDFFTYKVSFAGFSRSGSTNAWHGGLAPIAILLALAAAVLLAVEVVAKVRLAFPVRMVVLGAFALASLLLLLALFVVPG